MDKSQRLALSKARFRLKNQYAFIEYLEEMDTYAPELEAPAPPRYKDVQIEEKAKELLEYLWNNRLHLWDNSLPSDPVDLIDPSKALKCVGFDFISVEELEEYVADSSTKVAGLIDNESKVVKVSSRFPVTVRRFTAAHELGHAVLHNTGSSMHRDRPLDGTTVSRDFVERDADKFAAYFLMPVNLVKARFVEMFGTEVFHLSNETAVKLGMASAFEAKKKYRSLEDLSQLIAKTQYYDGRNVLSLAEQFHVSVTAMAIRLERLGLIEY